MNFLRITAAIVLFTLCSSYTIVKAQVIAHWKLDETSGTTVADELGTSNGTLENGADSMWVAGWDGNAIDFTKGAPNAGIIVADNDIVEFDSTESFTISMLIKADPVGNTAEQEIIMKGAFGVDSSQDWYGKWYGMQFKGGEVRLAVDDNVTKTQLGVNISAMWPSNRWAHLVGVRDVGAGMLKLYLNGQLIGEVADATVNDIASDSLPMLMGLNYQNLSQLDGQLDDVRFYDTALSEGAIDTLYESYGLPKDTLIAHWKLDETSGTTVADEFGTSDGMLENGADSMWVAGWDGNAIDFSKGAPNAGITVPDNDIVEFDSTESFTISMLIKADPVDNTAEQEIIMKGAFGVDASQGWEGKWYGMQFKSGEVRLAVDDNVTKTQLGVDISAIWPANRWAHLVGVRDVGSHMLKLYLNGQLIGEMEDGTENDIASGDLPMLMGLNYQGLSRLDGQLDDVRFYNYPLNPAAVEALFESYGIQKDAMIAYWKFNETSGTTVADQLGASNGTLENGADSMWVEGWNGNAIDFTKGAPNAGITVPDNSVVEFDSTESFTISMLIKADPVGNTAEQEIIMKGAFGVDESQDWYGKWYGVQFKSGEVRLAVDDNITKTQLGVKINDIWPSNEWAHLVCVRDRASGMLKLYLNGEPIGESEDLTENDIASDSLPMLMGLNYQGLSQLDGQLDELKFFNYPMNAGAVKEMYEAYNIPATQVAHWKLDETSGTSVSDELGNANGTLVNGADSMWVAGWDGNAIDFTKGAPNAGITVPDNDLVEFDSTESFSISMLIKADPVGNTAEQEIIMKGAFAVDSSQDWYGKWYGVQFKSGEVRLAVDDNVTKTQLGVDITSIWPSNEWAQLVCVRDVNAKTLRLYLNGQPIGESEDLTENDIASDSLPLLVGINYQGLSKLNGQLDDIRIFNYALSDNAVKSMFDESGIVVSVDPEEGIVPDKYALLQNYPNPFNPSTKIQFQIRREGHVTMSVYNMLGQLVTKLVDENLKVGNHAVTFNATNFASGVYFYRIEVNDFSQVKKMMLIK